MLADDYGSLVLRLVRIKDGVLYSGDFGRATGSQAGTRPALKKRAWSAPKSKPLTAIPQYAARRVRDDNIKAKEHTG